ncbi:hypothetical protein ACFLRI_05330 [Bacteroidota bacterium]
MMNIAPGLLYRKNAVKAIVFDLFAILFIYFIPALSHMAAIPLYMAEPMRIVLILALVHTHKKNAYILALTIPVFSFFVSMHPLFYKSLIMGIELFINVGLFYLILKKTDKVLPSIAFSILISKLIYYVMKFALIHFAFIQSELISTPIALQFIILAVLSGYVFLLFKKNERNSKPI